MRLCTNRSLAGDWEAAALWAREAVAWRAALPAFLLWTDVQRHYEIEALVRGGDEELARREVAHFQGGVGINRLLHITSLQSRAVIMTWEGNHKQAPVLLCEALDMAVQLRLPREQWEIGAAYAAAYRRDGQVGKAREAATRAVAVIEATAPILRTA